MERIDAVVIGAGVIGLAIARALAGRSVIVLEREATFGSATSSRNSEVIHAGLHYPHGSLRERLCIEGKRRLYDFCESHHVPHRRIGKLTFAGDASQLPRLEALAAHIRDADADAGLQWLGEADVARLEPELTCAAALLTPSSGIVDSHAYMLALLGEAQDRGAVLACHAPAERVSGGPGEWRVVSGDTVLAAGLVVNAAGLEAWSVAASTDALDPALIPPRHLAKGSYFAYTGRVPFNRLIYPLPVHGGLGTHLTLDMAGQARFGPDTEWVEEIDYRVDPARRPAFTKAVRRFWHAVDPERLIPGYAGIRPKIYGPEDPPADFLIQGEETHGLPGLVNLFGIDSPGLTASLALAAEIAQRLGQSDVG